MPSCMRNRNTAFRWPSDSAAHFDRFRAGFEPALFVEILSLGRSGGRGRNGLGNRVLDRRDRSQVREYGLQFVVGVVADALNRHGREQIAALAHFLSGANGVDEVLLCPVTQPRLVVGGKIAREGDAPTAGPGG